MKKYLLLLLLFSGCFLKHQNFSLEDLGRKHPNERVGFVGYHGQDILLLPLQNVAMISANWEKNESLGVMCGTAGGTIGPVDRIETQNYVPAIRWHVGGFCNHGASCLPGECKYTDNKCLRNKTLAIKKLHEKHPTTKDYCSPRAEYPTKDRKLVQSWFDTIHIAYPDCILVASAMGGYIPPGVLVERHGNTPGWGNITSNDGSDYFQSNSVKYNSIADVMSLSWTPRYNRRLTSMKPGQPVPPPTKRPVTNNISKDYFLQMELMQHTPPPPAPKPAVCKFLRGFLPGETVKIVSEDYGISNGATGAKPLFITRSKNKKMSILSPSGAVIGCFAFDKSHSSLYNGMLRLYEGSCSGLTPYGLYKKAGGENAFIKDGNTCIAFSTIRRSGSFHN